ncbi:MAG: response regulator, partial [Elusimicrobia bacterium]|nr:response regulator [Elusimicrobiota bacterium]
MTALVVDDDPGMRRICCRALEQLGLAVVAAENRREAGELLRSSAFAVVLTDVHMAEPGEGVALAEEIKSRSPDTAVVVMTGQPSLDTAIPALKHGASDYLSKPFAIAHLQSVVQGCLDRRRLVRELGEERTVRRELEAAYQELQKVERVKDAFLARINHELRTPVSVALMAAQALGPRLADAEGRELWLKLDRSLEGLREIVEELLLYARLARKEVEPQRSALDAAELLRELVERHRALWEERGLAVELVCDGTKRPIAADPALLRTAFSHLLLNAIRFNERGGRIVIRCLYGKETRFVFEDTGIGVPQESVADVFDSFYQVAEHLTRNVGGLGL